MSQAALKNIQELEVNTSLNIQYMGWIEPPEMDKKSCYHKKCGDLYSSLGDAQRLHILNK